jgi:hypothetical protein
MPKYRQLHTKTIDSFDFNEMPDDFTRVVWLLLPLILDREGRGINSMAWVKSKMFPLRDDIKPDKIQNAFTWFTDRKMLICYQVSGHNYFYIPTWKTYQSGTEREAPSVLPTPDKVATNSGVIPDKVATNSGVIPDKVDVAASASALNLNCIESELPKTEFAQFMDAFFEETHIPETSIKPQNNSDAIDKMVSAGVTVEDMRYAIREMLEKKLHITCLASVINGSISVMSRRRANKPLHLPKQANYPELKIL